MTTAAENLKRQREARIDCACLQVAFVVAQSIAVIKANMPKPRKADSDAYERVTRRLLICKEFIKGREKSAAYQRRLGEGWAKAKDAILAVKAPSPHVEGVAIVDALTGVVQGLAFCIPKGDVKRRRAWFQLASGLNALYDRLVKPLKVDGVGEISWPLLAGLADAMIKELEVAA